MMYLAFKTTPLYMGVTQLKVLFKEETIENRFLEEEHNTHVRQLQTDQPSSYISPLSHQSTTSAGSSYALK